MKLSLNITVIIIELKLFRPPVGGEIVLPRRGLSVFQPMEYP